MSRSVAGGRNASPFEAIVSSSSAAKPKAYYSLDRGVATACHSVRSRARRRGRPNRPSGATARTGPTARGPPRPDRDHVGQRGLVDLPLVVGRDRVSWKGRYTMLLMTPRQRHRPDVRTHLNTRTRRSRCNTRTARQVPGCVWTRRCNRERGPVGVGAGALSDGGGCITPAAGCGGLRCRRRRARGPSRRRCHGASPCGSAGGRPRGRLPACRRRARWR